MSRYAEEFDIDFDYQYVCDDKVWCNLHGKIEKFMSLSHCRHRETLKLSMGTFVTHRNIAYLIIKPSSDTLVWG